MFTLLVINASVVPNASAISEIRVPSSPEQEQQFQKIELEVRDELRKTIYSKVSREELNNYVNTLYKFADK